MPTGYTEDIKKGITFPQFAMSCAKAFGACVTMRDDPAKVPIPDEFKPSDWHEKQLTRAKRILAKLENMTEDEAATRARVECNIESQHIAKAVEETRDLVAKYNSMLENVKRWQPPTSDHIELKAFMLQQIESSIKFDDMEPYYLEHPAKLLSAKDWLTQKIKEAKRDIAYHTKENQEEIERVASRNAWIKALRASL